MGLIGLIASIITIQLYFTVSGSSDGRLLNTAFFDVHTKSQSPMLDYIQYSTRGSFDVKQYADTVSKIKENNTYTYIHGRIVVPESITTEKVYMSVGSKYKDSYGSYWGKTIRYNGSKVAQNSDYFLVGTKKDAFGKGYVDYKIRIDLKEAWIITPAEKRWAPNTFFFKMAPKVRGFKDKFVPVDIYILEE